MIINNTISNSIVSVIIPVYNVYSYIREALESVIHQSYPYLEILIIDDGSTDGSELICDEYKRDPRVRVIHQANKGLSAARNTGLDIMTGDFVAFLDPDDAYHTDFIQNMISALLQNEADLVICNYSKIKTTGLLTQGDKRKSPFIRTGVYDRCKALRALADNYFDHSIWNKLYRCEIWRDIRFPDGHVYEDMEIGYLLINKCNTVYVMDDILYLHRIRTGSITQTKSINNILDLLYAVSKVEDFLRRNTPGIFSEEQLTRKKAKKLSIMMRAYAMIVCTKRNRIEGRKLREQIIQKDNLKIYNSLKIKTRIAYLIICICPWLLIILYPLYRKFARFKKR